MEKRTCHNCQTENDASAQFCCNCGNRFSNKPTEEENIKKENNNLSQEANISDIKHCPHCGEEIKAIAKKCKHCGSWLAEKVEKPKEKKQIECPTCAELVDEGTQTCTYCKQPIKTKSKRSFLDDEDGEIPDFSKYFNFKNPGRMIIGIVGAILLFLTKYVPLLTLSATCGISHYVKSASYTLNDSNDISSVILGWLMILMVLLTIIICFREQYKKMFVPLIGTFIYVIALIFKIVMFVNNGASGSISYSERLPFAILSGCENFSGYPGWGWLLLIIAVALIVIASFSFLSKMVSFFIPAKSIANFFKDLVK